MKKSSILLALMCLLLAVSCLAEGSMTPKEQAQSYLTEVYGYTEEEAEAFVFEDNGKGTLTYYSKDHPAWAYQLIYADDRILDSTTPFYTDYADYPGENVIRTTLRAMKEQHIPDNWAQGGQKALQDMLSHSNIVPTQALRAMLSGNTDKFEGNKLIEAFFLSCYGEENNWPEALGEWYNETLTAFGFDRPLTRAEQPDGIETVPDVQTSMGAATLIRFKGAVPDSLKAVLDAQPRLKGWQCLAGAVLDAQAKTDDFLSLLPEWRGVGLAAFEQGNERLLVSLRKDKSGLWHFFPLGTNALYGPPQRLSIDYGNRPNIFNIRYEHAGETTVFDVHLRTRMFNDAPVGEDCFVIRLRFSNQTVTTTMVCNFNGQCKVTEVRDGRRTDQAFIASAPMMLGVQDIHSFPRSLEDSLRPPASYVPEDYIIVEDVHLRQKTSSRSKDLGMLCRGAFVRMLGMEPGQPYEWVHAKVGDLTGYISSIYTSAGENGVYTPSYLSPLLLAETTRETDLKKDTGRFSGTVQRLPKGTRMHVIMERGSFLYVVIPRETIGWRMDVDGTYGFISKDAVRLAPLPIQLDWMNDETSPNP